MAAKFVGIQVTEIVTTFAGMAFTSHDPYKILLIGETGSGKTSFLNFICNAEIIERYGANMVKAVEEFRSFNDVKLEDATSKKMESKTTGAKVYRTKIMDLDVDVIDTPGFGDSRGMEQDKENVESIISTLREESYINCICLIVNGRQARISATLKYVLSEITDILPQHVVNNIVVVFTNVSMDLDLNFDVEVLGEYLDQKDLDKHVFLLENPYCRFEKAKKQQLLTEKWINDNLKKYLEDASTMLRNLHQVISKLQQIHTKSFDQLFEMKQAIERDVMKLLQEYDYQKKLESAIKKARGEVEVAARSKHLKDFKLTRTVTVDRWAQEDTEKYNTICGAKDCNSNCHIRCSVPRMKFKFMIWFCDSIKKNGECRKCGHSYKLHYHNTVINKKEEVTFEELDEDGIKAKLSSLDLERKKLLKELNTSIKKYQQVGLNRSYITLLERQLELIKQRMEGEAGQDLMVLKENIEAQIRKKL